MKSRFVLLRHIRSATADRASHWDLMLEDQGNLLTWSLAQLPAVWLLSGGRKLSSLEPVTVPAVRLPAHRIDYLHYEGPVSHNRGYVIRCAAGTCTWQECSESTMSGKLTGLAFSCRFTIDLTNADEQSNDRLSLYPLIAE